MVCKLDSAVRYLALISCLCFATTAQAAQSAQNANSIYGGIFGGFTFQPDLKLSGGGLSGDMETDSGFAFGGVLGHKWAFGLRAEGEISFRQNDLDNINGASVNGDTSAFSVMGNAWYDIFTGTPFVPYVGGGLGLARVRLDSSTLDVDDSDMVFAWQIGGGVGYEISPGVVISGDYRYFETADASLQDDVGFRFDQEYKAHSIMFGLRGHF
jgi:outer membrane immunogenic protein